jgi:SOS response regulatory protein OraA/RecX
VTDSAYLAGLRMLARRELSEQQLRQQLARRHHDPGAIDSAVVRLKEDRSLDDERVSGALARSEVGLKRHGRLRAQRQMEAAGITPALARRALDEVFASVDPDELIATALAKRLRWGNLIEDDAHFRRLYRFLLGQGFEPDRVLATLRAHRMQRGPS